MWSLRIKTQKTDRPQWLNEIGKSTKINANGQILAVCFGVVPALPYHPAFICIFREEYKWSSRFEKREQKPHALKKENRIINKYLTIKTENASKRTLKTEKRAMNWHLLFKNLRFVVFFGSIFAHLC